MKHLNVIKHANPAEISKETNCLPQHYKSEAPKARCRIRNYLLL